MAAPRPPRRVALTGALAAVAAPAALTAVLLHLGEGQPRDYVFLYLGVVAALGVTQGLLPALLAAAASFLLVDYYFVRPVRALTIADAQDVVNLVVFFTAAGVVGGLGSRRRRAQLRAEALTRELRDAYEELARLSREHAEAAEVAVRLVRTQQQVRLLEESDRVRREFLATVSHELRTPLAGILTGSTVLARRADLPEPMRHHARSIAEQARRLDRLVGDMLDMARIEGNTLDLRLEQVDLGDAVVAAADRLHQHSPQRAVEVEVPPDTAVMADWDRLGQVIDNLFHNATRYAPEGTPIVARATPGADGVVVLRVIDRGPGIPESLRDHVFDRFVRGNGAADDGGTGLGLAIVRGLVEAQAGRVWVDQSEDGSGACVAISLPAAPAEAAQHP
jgi:two-component system, OmpR family, sensor histidine kinase KdpD